MPTGHPDPQIVQARYDEVYAPSLDRPDDSLVISVDGLLLNYGVFDPDRDRDSERLPLALRMLDLDNIRGKTILDFG